MPHMGPALVYGRGNLAALFPTAVQTRCPTHQQPVKLHTLATVTLLVLLGGLRERLEAQSIDTTGSKFTAVYPSLADWASEAYSGWPVGSSMLVKAAYFITRFPALYIHGMVLHW
jgi:hypothetical protein